MRRVAILGSTGAIGRATIEVLEHLAPDYRISALAAFQDTTALARQVRYLRPDVAGVVDERRGPKLAQAVAGLKARVVVGRAGLEAVARSRKIDILVVALSGTTGLAAVLAALAAGKRICLATKEIMVAYGGIVMAQARRRRAEILPIDSELAAIHQCLAGQARQDVARILLTASGGPFWSERDLSQVNVQQALSHPTWRMGRKITVDSATLMNKGLEVIETARYFDISPEQIEVLIHPQSIVHSMVEFRDGSVLAQLAVPDMRLPIQYCLTWPERGPSMVRPIRVADLKTLTFERPDFKRFPCLGLARRAARQGGLAPCRLNAANEVAVRAFLAHRISFLDIAVVVEQTLRAFRNEANPSLARLVQAEQEAASRAEKICRRLTERRKHRCNRHREETRVGR